MGHPGAGSDRVARHPARGAILSGRSPIVRAVGTLGKAEPSIFWLGWSDGALTAGWIAGALCALAAIFVPSKWAMRAALLAALALGFRCAPRPGVFALLSMGRPAPAKRDSWRSSPTILRYGSGSSGGWAFRLMFYSGVVKLTSGGARIGETSPRCTITMRRSRCPRLSRGMRLRRRCGFRRLRPYSRSPRSWLRHFSSSGPRKVRHIGSLGSCSRLQALIHPDR